MCKKMKSCAQIYTWIYRCDIHQLPLLSLKVRTSITFQSCFDCMETEVDWWSLFRGLRICISFLVMNIFCAVEKVNIYTQMMVHLQGGATTWINAWTTPFTKGERWQKGSHCWRFHSDRHLVAREPVQSHWGGTIYPVEVSSRIRAQHAFRHCCGVCV